MTALTSGPHRTGPDAPAAPSGSGIRGVAALDPLDRAAFDLAISEEIERAGPDADPVDLADRAMARLRQWKAGRAGAAVMAVLDRGRTLATLHDQAKRPHPDRRLVAACERFLLHGADAGLAALPERITGMRPRTAMGRRAKAEVALALLETCEEPAATLARSVILDALAGLPADRA